LNLVFGESRTGLWLAPSASAGKGLARPGDLAGISGDNLV